MFPECVNAKYQIEFEVDASGARRCAQSGANRETYHQAQLFAIKVVLELVQQPRFARLLLHSLRDYKCITD